MKYYLHNIYLTQLQIEINELCGIFLLKGRNRVRVFELQSLLIYKNPILYKDLTFNKVRNELAFLFPIYKNNRKRTKYFKISKKLYETNRFRNNLVFKPIEDILLKTYGINEDYFKKV